MSKIDGWGPGFKGDPFAGFTTSIGRIVQPADPINADTALFENLAPGEGYAVISVRLDLAVQSLTTFVAIL